MNYQTLCHIGNEPTSVCFPQHSKRKTRAKIKFHGVLAKWVVLPFLVGRV